VAIRVWIPRLQRSREGYFKEREAEYFLGRHYDGSGVAITWASDDAVMIGDAKGALKSVIKNNNTDLGTYQNDGVIELTTPDELTQNIILYSVLDFYSSRRTSYIIVECAMKTNSKYLKEDKLPRGTITTLSYSHRS
jgi:hypothetical protein